MRSTFWPRKSILLKFDEIDPDTKIKEEVALTIDADELLCEYRGRNLEIRFSVRNTPGNGIEFNQHLSNLHRIQDAISRTGRGVPATLTILYPDFWSSHKYSVSKGGIESVSLTQATIIGTIITPPHVGSTDIYSRHSVNITDKITVCFIGSRFTHYDRK